MRLGIADVERYIFNGLTAKQFRGWELYDEVEPFEMAEDYRVAAILQILYNVNRGKGPALKIKDFVDSIRYERQNVFNNGDKSTKQTPQQQFGMMQILAAMHANDATPVVPSPGGAIEPTDEQVARAIEAARKAMH